MGIKDVMESLKSLTYLDLGEQGEAEVVVFVGEPEVVEAEYKGKPRTRFIFPCLTADGLRLFATNRATAKRLAPMYEKMVGKPCLLAKVGKDDMGGNVFSWTRMKGETPAWVAEAKLDEAKLAKMMLEASGGLQGSATTSSAKADEWDE